MPDLCPAEILKEITVEGKYELMNNHRSKEEEEERMVKF